MEQGRCPREESETEDMGSTLEVPDLDPCSGIILSVSTAEEDALLAEEMSAVALEPQVDGSNPVQPEAIRY